MTTSPPDPDWRDTVVVIDLPRRSQSLHWRFYAEDLSGKPVLQWVVQRLCHASSSCVGVFVLAEAAETARVERAIADDRCARTWRRTAASDMEQLAGVLASSGARRVCVVDASASLLPKNLLSTLLREHRDRGAHASCMEGVPCSPPPVIVERECVEHLAESGLVGNGTGLWPTLTDLERRHTIRLATGELRIQRVPVTTCRDMEHCEWPISVRFETADELTVLRDVVTELASGCEAQDLLRSWTRAAREREGAEIRVLRRSGCESRPTAAATKRLLFVSAPSAFSGGEQSMVVLADAMRLARPDYALTALVSLGGVLTDRLAAAGVDVIVANRTISASSVKSFLYARARLSEVRPVLVHANGVVGVPFGCALEEFGIPLVQHVRVASEPKLRELLDQLRMASAVIAVSHFVRQRLVRHGVDPHKIEVIHNGTTHVAPPADSRARLRGLYGIGDRAPVVLTVARFAANKRVDIVIEAFARVVARLPDARLLIAGEALEGTAVREQVLKRAAQLRLVDRIHWLGFHGRIAEVFAAADAFVLASEDDPLPRAVMEAAAAGVPVIAAASGGTPEMITHEDNGLLVRPGDPEEFARATEAILTDRALHRRLIDRALARSRSDFSAERYCQSVLRVYDRVFAGHSLVA